jgi:hypothetical protein
MRQVSPSAGVNGGRELGLQLGSENARVAGETLVGYGNSAERHVGFSTE